MKKYYETALDLIGNTPMLKINNMGLPEGINAFAKLELYNPAGSVKDRVGKAMLDDAAARGLLQPGGTIIESTAGNTGLGIAMAAANQGYRLIFVVPDKFSIEKQILMRALGAEVINTPAELGMGGATAKAEELRNEIPGAVMLGQFQNPANPRVHYEQTGPEIWEALDGQIDYFVAGVGSGGTFSGIVRYLKEQNPAIKGVLVDPVGSTMGGGEPGAWDIEGIGNLAIPATMDMSLVDDVVKVESAEAAQFSRALALREGILAGPSSGADMAAVVKLAQKISDSQGMGSTLPGAAQRRHPVEKDTRRPRLSKPEGTMTGEINIVTIFPDRGARYFSKHLYE